MKVCRYCGRELPPSDVRTKVTFCSACGLKRDAAHRFVKVCDEFKKRINYPYIKLKMEAEKNDQRTTTSV